MPISEHETEFAGKQVLDWDPETGITEPETAIYRISMNWEDGEAGRRWTDYFAQFLADPRSAEVTGIVVGAWMGDSNGDSAPVVEALVAARDRLPNVTAIFLGDITYEENEISWIRQSDVSPLFDAYPNLEHFRVRGATGLTLGAVRHERLRSLTIECGGMPRSVFQEAIAADLPNLEHLELWLGTEDYGGEVAVEDLAPLLEGSKWPNLTYLGLRDSEIADEIAAALQGAPILSRIKTLDLSLGTLTDEGAEALLSNPAIQNMEKLDLHRHYLSDEMIAKLEALPIEVDVSEKETAEEYDGETYRYVAVGE